jgi:hypothetical protein
MAVIRIVRHARIAPVEVRHPNIPMTTLILQVVLQPSKLQQPPQADGGGVVTGGVAQPQRQRPQLQLTVTQRQQQPVRPQPRMAGGALGGRKDAIRKWIV